MAVKQPGRRTGLRPVTGRMPGKKGMPHIGGAMGKKKGAPKGTKAHTFTTKG